MEPNKFIQALRAAGDRGGQYHLQYRILTDWTITPDGLEFRARKEYRNVRKVASWEELERYITDVNGLLKAFEREALHDLMRTLTNNEIVLPMIRA